MKLRDAQLFAQHSELKTLFSGSQTPNLRLKTDGFDGSGQVKKETLNAIASEDPVVALVINAIDDHLKGGTQVDQPWTLNEIAALRDVLDKARESGRAVMLASDHGHVSGQRLEYAGAGTGERGSRWRPWIKGDSVAEYEIAVESEYAWSPKGKDVQVVCPPKSSPRKMLESPCRDRAPRRPCR